MEDYKWKSNSNPSPEYGENYREFYLLCADFCVVVDMFACPVETDEEAAQIAYNNGPDYIDPSQYQ